MNSYINDYRSEYGKTLKKSNANESYARLVNDISNFRNSWDGKLQDSSKPMMRDGSHASGSGGSGGGGGGSQFSYTKYNEYIVYDEIGQYVFMHCGVPAWVDCDSNEIETKLESNLILGSGTPEETLFGFNSGYEFFTNDPTENGIYTFDFPFSYNQLYVKKPKYATKSIDYRGTLSNWWSGDEPMFQIVSNMLSSGILTSSYCGTTKYNSQSTPHKVSIPGIGYMFRPNVPRLIFAFSNEFDNNMTRTYNSRTGGSTETEYVKTLSNYDWEWYDDQHPLDPYCL